MDFSPEDIFELIDAALAADYTRVKRVGGRIAQSLSKTEPDTAKALRSLIRKRGVPLMASGYAEALPTDAKSRLPLLEEQPWPTSPLFLDEDEARVLHSFVEDAKNVDLLSRRGLSSRLSLLLSGAPGTGKTLLAGRVAEMLERPLYVIRLDSVVSSMLGDTAKNVRSVFDFVPSRQAVLFIDEMDAVAKVRDDRHELGELKRVVNTVLQGLDSLDDQAIVIGATNHPQLLDPAVWRRFPYRIDLTLPSDAVRTEMWRHFLGLDVADGMRLLSLISEGLSGAEIKNISLSARRQAVLDNKEIDLICVAWGALQASRGRPSAVPRQGLSSVQKKELAEALMATGSTTRADVARLYGVSRQAIAHYLKDQDIAN